MPEFHGWRGPSGAVYISVDPVTGNPALYAMDAQGDREPLAEMYSTGAALKLQAWLDETLSASGEVNAMLMEQLEEARADPGTWPT